MGIVEHSNLISLPCKALHIHPPAAFACHEGLVLVRRVLTPPRCLVPIYGSANVNQPSGGEGCGEGGVLTNIAYAARVQIGQH